MCLFLSYFSSVFVLMLMCSSQFPMLFFNELRLFAKSFAKNVMLSYLL